jgi:hypothetical protein
MNPAERSGLVGYHDCKPVYLDEFKATCPPGTALESPEGLRTLADVLAELARLGVSRRIIERERSAGRLPKPDLHIGRMPLWRVETVRAWLESGDGR